MKWINFSELIFENSIAIFHRRNKFCPINSHHVHFQRVNPVEEKFLIKNEMDTKKKKKKNESFYFKKVHRFDRDLHRI